MTHPAVTIQCRGPCKRVLYQGGEIGSGGPVGLPFADGEQILKDFADSACPIGGTANGCPSTTESMAVRDEEQPPRLRQLVKAAKTRLDTLDGRADLIEQRRPAGVSLTLPALTANTPIEVTVPWPRALPNTNYQVQISQEFAAQVLLGAIATAVKAGTRAVDGCTLLVAATRAVNAGQAGLHVVAIP